MITVSIVWGYQLLSLKKKKKIRIIGSYLPKLWLNTQTQMASTCIMYQFSNVTMCTMDIFCSKSLDVVPSLSNVSLYRKGDLRTQ